MTGGAEHVWEQTVPEWGSRAFVGWEQRRDRPESRVGVDGEQT